MTSYLYPPQRKIIKGRYYFLASTTGKNQNSAQMIAASYRSRGYLARVVGFKAPSYVYSEGAVYYVYYR